MHLGGRILACLSRSSMLWTGHAIVAGPSLNGNGYSSRNLAAVSESLFPGRPVNAFSRIDADGNPINDHVGPLALVGKSPLNQVGVVKSARWDESAGATAVTIQFLDTAAGRAMDDHLRALEAAGALGSIGLSIDGEGPLGADGNVELRSLASLDIVTHPAAGGRFLHRIAASRSAGVPTMRTLLALLTASHARLVEGYKGAASNAFGIARHVLARAKADPTVADALHKAIAAEDTESKRFTEAKDEAALLAEVYDLCARVTEAEAKAVADEAQRQKEAADDAARKAKELADKGAGGGGSGGAGKEGPADPEARRQIEALRVAESRTRLTSAIDAARLPAEAKAALLLQHGNAILKDEDVTRVVEGMRKVVDDAINASGERVTIVRESRDKNVEALAHLLSPRCAAPREGVADFHGSMNTFLEKRFGLRIREAFIDGSSRRRAKESVDATNFDAIFAEALNRAMLAEYRGNPALDMGWRRIVNVVSESDFRTKEVIATSMYGVLPDVAEDGVYQPLTTPTDRKESYALAKKGGLESITMEKMLNDDLGLWRSMIRRIGVAARQTISEAVFALIRVATMPTMSDTNKLMSASRASPHTNLDTSSNALTADATGWGYYVGGVVAMAKKTNGGAIGLGIVPKILVIPFSLAKVAGQLFSDFSPAQAADIPTRRGLEVVGAALPEIVIDPGTGNTTDWFQMADPADAEVIRVAFLNGKEDPEIIIADGQGFGSMFARDKVELKARHIFVAGAVDHMGINGHDVT